VKTWHLLAPEFPPGCGGVGDYSALLAGGLERSGDRVRVWHPHLLPDRFGRRSRHVLDSAIASEPGIVLVQYVPAAFGLRGMNVPFCRWIGKLRRRGVDVRVMFHEPFFYFGFSRPWRNVFALVQRGMARLLLQSATRVYYSTETWKRLLAPFGSRMDAEVLPIPATIPVDVASEAVTAARGRSRGPLVLGHFCTYGDHVAGELSRVLPEILRTLPDARMQLAGRGAGEFARSLIPAVRKRIDVVPDEDGVAIAAALRACHILVQPYPDGVTTRRTSMMAALTSGVSVITTQGRLTEAVWTESNAVSLAPAGDDEAFVERAVQLARNPELRREMGARGRRLYDEQFALPVTLSRLRRN